MLYSSYDKNDSVIRRMKMMMRRRRRRKMMMRSRRVKIRRKRIKMMMIMMMRSDCVRVDRISLQYLIRITSAKGQFCS